MASVSPSDHLRASLPPLGAVGLATSPTPFKQQRDISKSTLIMDDSGLERSAPHGDISPLVSTDAETSHTMEEAAPFTVRSPDLKRTYSGSTGSISEDSTTTASPIGARNDIAQLIQSPGNTQAPNASVEKNIDIEQLLDQLTLADSGTPGADGARIEKSPATMLEEQGVHGHPFTTEPAPSQTGIRTSHDNSIGYGRDGLEVALPHPAPVHDTSVSGGNSQDRKSIEHSVVQPRALIFDFHPSPKEESSEMVYDEKISLENSSEHSPADTSDLVRQSTTISVGEIYEAPAIQNSYLEAVILSIDAKSSKSVAHKITNKPNLPTRFDVLPKSARKEALIDQRRCAYRLTNSDPNGEKALVGTAVYIGRGLFLTAAHNLQVPTGSTSNRLLLDHGDKRRDKFGALAELKNPACFFADPVAYMTIDGTPKPCPGFIPTSEFEAHVPNSNGITPQHALDLAVIRIKIQPGQDAPPDSEALHPYPTALGISPFPSKFWGCNYASPPEIKLAYDAYYKYAGVKEKELDSLIQKLRSGECTRAKGEVANFVTATGSPVASTDNNALFLRHDISAINGASGSAITMRYVDTVGKRDGLVGIHVKAVYRLRDGQGQAPTKPVNGAKYRLETENYAVNIQHPNVRKFLAETFASLEKDVDMAAWSWKQYASQR
ncbi:hypothetical protein BJ508DRAFT_328873 [Ascobolus immersus RN42]|uniref:Serine protease n=1 Tax=Ascobolus immersus RN42 TaxID=1160509 RepID=A0A3N4HYB0_ASCIM|nr:hypothetical protein BJ508DRAFT_328873 [Ascobolus immersus RN42]